MRQMIVSEYNCFGVAWPDDMIQIFGEDIDRDSPDACEHVIKMKKLSAEERRKAIYEYYRLKIKPEGRVDSDLCGSSVMERNWGLSMRIILLDAPINPTMQRLS